MKLFHWNDELNTGMAEIDLQHQELIKRINSFLKACMKEPRDYRQLFGTFSFLNDYVIEHFDLEEKLMLEHQFPQIENHLKDHKGFRQWVDQASARLEKREFPEDLVMEANYRLVEWLTLHIRNRDRNMTNYLKQIAKEKKIPSLLALIHGTNR